jgi:hypothetical protein
MVGDIDLWTGEVRTIYNAYTVTRRDRIICCGLGIVVCAITLPAAALVRGLPFVFYYISPDALGYAVTITAAGSDTIIASTGLETEMVICTEGDYLILYSDGVYWHVLGYVNLVI